MLHLPRSPLRFDESQKRDSDPEIDWFPEWRCFCCHDSGFIRHHLVLQVVPDYNELVDKIPVCQNCTVRSKFSQEYRDSFDYRFNSQICKELHEFSRQDWVKTCQEKARRRIEFSVKTIPGACRGISDQEALLRKENAQAELDRMSESPESEENYDF